MSIDTLLALTQKQLNKGKKTSADILRSDKEPIPTGLIIDNPLMEFIFDRRFIPFGRMILLYGKKGSSKTSLFYDMAKAFQKQGGYVLLVETEHALDLRYAEKQGVDTTKMYVTHPTTLEDAIEAIKAFIKNIPKAFPDGKTPILIGLDSIAGSAVEYEIDSRHTISDTQPGLHARLMSRFCREIEKPLANENCTLVLLNQLKGKIGGMGYGEDSLDALIGGEAQFFHSSVHFKMAKMAEFVDDQERKAGSKHSIKCKRNKLGREGKNQEVVVNLFIDGGIDWWSCLVDKLKASYSSLVTGAGAYVKWKVPDVVAVDPETGEQIPIDTEKNYRAQELAFLIQHSTQAKEIIREAFGIPPLEDAAALQEAEEARKAKRKKAQEEPEEDNSAVLQATVKSIKSGPIPKALPLV